MNIAKILQATADGRPAKVCGLVMILVTLTLCRPAYAEDKPPLRVGIHEIVPYAMKNSGGEWDGLGVELWKKVAAATGIRYEFIEMPFEQLLPALADGKLDLAVGEVTISSEREATVRFTQPFLTSSPGVAMGAKPAGVDWRKVAGSFFSRALMFVLFGIFAGMLLVSLLVWVIERRRDDGHFRGGLAGFGSALWFSASTVTGVGYGDKIPATLFGRVVSFVWMLVGVLLVAGFTATVAASLSNASLANQNGHLVKDMGDLRHFSCGVIRGSLTQQIFIRDGVGFRDYETFSEAFQAMADGIKQSPNKLSKVEHL